MENIPTNVCRLKQEFVKVYEGNSHTTEILPNSNSNLIPIEDDSLSFLHTFLSNNPIYSSQISKNVMGMDCTVFEGDLNNYWIDSIKHDASYAPFYPTWMLSAFYLALEAQNLGFTQIVDIGSGDGRIAYCGKVLGMNSVSIEIDSNLTSLQDEISKKTNIQFNPICHDAITYDFEALSDKKSIFVIGGVPELGEVLEASVISAVLKLLPLKNSAFVLTGSHSHRKFSRDPSNFGWGTSIKKFGLEVISSISLPTYWTMDQEFDTPYVFTKKG